MRIIVTFIGYTVYEMYEMIR